MDVFIERTNKRRKLDYDGNVGGLLKELNISISSSIVVRDNMIITKDTRLHNNDKLKILSVISGG